MVRRACAAIWPLLIGAGRAEEPLSAGKGREAADRRRGVFERLSDGWGKRVDARQPGAPAPLYNPVLPSLTLADQPFLPDYFETVISLCEIIRQVYIKLGLMLVPADDPAGGPGGTPQTATASTPHTAGASPYTPDPYRRVSEQAVPLSGGAPSAYNPPKSAGPGGSGAFGEGPRSASVSYGAGWKGPQRAMPWSPALCELITKADGKLKVSRARQDHDVLADSCAENHAHVYEGARGDRTQSSPVGTDLFAARSERSIYDRPITRPDDVDLNTALGCMDRRHMLVYRDDLLCLLWIHLPSVQHPEYSCDESFICGQTSPPLSRRTQPRRPPRLRCMPRGRSCPDGAARA